MEKKSVYQAPESIVVVIECQGPVITSDPNDPEFDAEGFEEG